MGDGYSRWCVALGAEIRRRRRTHGLTLKDLSGRCGLNIGFLSQIERADCMASVRSLSRIAAALGARIVDILPEIETP